MIDAVEDVDCVLVGTLYKEMKLKPSILDEYVKDKTTQQHLGVAPGGELGASAGLALGHAMESGSGLEKGMCR